MHQYPYFSRKIILVLDFIEIFQLNSFLLCKTIIFRWPLHNVLLVIPSKIDKSFSFLSRSQPIKVTRGSTDSIGRMVAGYASQLSRDVTRTHEAASRGRGHWRVGGLPPVPSRDQLRLAGGSGGGGSSITQPHLHTRAHRGTYLHNVIHDGLTMANEGATTWHVSEKLTSKS